MIKVGLLSLGCSKNQVDSEIMLGLIAEAGYQVVDNYKSSDVLIVNTCGFIDDAKEESINSILELAQYKQEGTCKLLIVTGCLGQRYSQELEEQISEIDAILGTGNFDQIVEVIEESLEGAKRIEVENPDFDYDRYLPKSNLSPNYTAYLKIAEGCNNCCSYCVIPQLRGTLKSRSIETIVDEAERLAQQGVKEVNIIAQDITQYGLDLYGESKLIELLKELVKVEGIKWFRLLYAYPSHLTDQLIELIAAEDKICNYLDLPVQHADATIRERMNRTGSQDDILAVIKKLRAKIPDISLRTSLIVGFPGETEREFQNLIDFVTEAEFDRLGVFTYSQEEGTPAAKMAEQIPEEVKEERYEEIMKLQQEISYQRNQEWIGKQVTVLVEEVQAEEAPLVIGRTERDAPEIDGVVYVKDSTAEVGELIEVEIVDAYEYDLMGVEVK
ncbi:30S ribosomal protein S12 methylthiotransferase RimO [Natroniella sulfidigena]|uniref:30S ribosomal protein S12 methylthiotransferase RimO n=1 Tax=Natroniella sulfidigena TaxID=723921 RepID=UPI00200B500C|nr:30S ribosomal protein S12 methylthiotransferase RimO [Natroniella sulfidigena]MCK8817416.1 30S ribosomal protein S12 methylthiotransferase RimO [Natroniella sulfidigena]